MGFLIAGTFAMGWALYLPAHNPDALFSLGLGMSLPGIWEAAMFWRGYFKRKLTR